MTEHNPDKINGAEEEVFEVTLTVGTVDKSVVLVVEIGDQKPVRLTYTPKEAMNLGGAICRAAGEAHKKRAVGRIVRPKLRFPRR